MQLLDYFKTGLEAIVKWAWDLLAFLFPFVGTYLKDFFFWAFEQICDFFIAALNTFDLSALSGLGSWASLPPSIINVLGYLGIGQAVVIISGALLIRLTLQLIPFVRLGS
jgi:hypothetical protein